MVCDLKSLFIKISTLLLFSHVSFCMGLNPTGKRSSLTGRSLLPSEKCFFCQRKTLHWKESSHWIQLTENTNNIHIVSRKFHLPYCKLTLKFLTATGNVYKVYTGTEELSCFISFACVI